MKDRATPDDPVTCGVCGHETSVAMISTHLRREHGIELEEIADGPIIDATGEAPEQADRGRIWKGEIEEEPKGLIADFDQAQQEAREALRRADVFYLVTGRRGELPQAYTSSTGSFAIETVSRFFEAAARTALELRKKIIDADDGTEEL